MQFKYFLFESLLLATVEAGPLRKVTQFQYPRQDGAPQNNSTTAAVVQSQASSTILSESLASSSVLTATGAPQVSAASLFDNCASPNSDPDYSEVLTVLPTTASPTPSQDTTDTLVSVITVSRKSTTQTYSTTIVPPGIPFSLSILTLVTHTEVLDQRQPDSDHNPRYRFNGSICISPSQQHSSRSELDRHYPFIYCAGYTV